MKWNALETEEQFKDILEKSTHTPQVIFKHSTRCGVSAVAKYRLEKNSPPDNIDFHLLNVLANRILSNKIAKQLEVQHETPQVILVKNGHCIYQESHFGITMNTIAEQSIAA